jgi:DNA-binding MarR family transcriptional regulator
MTTMRANEGTSRTVADDEAVAANAESTSSPFDEAVQFGILEELVGFHLRLADDRTFENFARGLGPDRLWPGCFTMLTLIVNNPGITQITLSRASGRDKSSVTKDLRYMEDAGLIRRVRLSEDRRSYASFVTQEGAELSERLTREVKAHSTRLTSIIGEDRKALLLAILKDLINNLPEPRNSAARD